MPVQFPSTKVNSAARRIKQPRVSVPLFNRCCMATVSSSQAFDCGNRLGRCDFDGGLFLGVSNFGTRTPADRAASVENR
jgi:hypothetical protein